jgi:hypothetical protein
MNLGEELYQNLILIDTGSNLTNKKFSRDLDQVIERSKNAGNFDKILRSIFSNFYNLFEKVISYSVYK